MNHVQVHPVFVRLLAHTLPGETLIETLDRLIATRARATAGHAHEKKEARDAQYAFAAAILSQPGQELRINQTAIHAIDGSYEIQQFEDLRERQFIYRVRRIGGGATMLPAIGTSGIKGDSSMGEKTEKTTTTKEKVERDTTSAPGKSESAPGQQKSKPAKSGEDDSGTEAEGSGE